MFGCQLVVVAQWQRARGPGFEPWRQPNVFNSVLFKKRPVCEREYI